MKAHQLAEKLMEHPDADVTWMVQFWCDESDLDYYDGKEFSYDPDFERFIL